MPEFPTDAWFQAFRERIQASATYRDAASTWEGEIAFRVQADPSRGIPRDVYAILDLWHGECRSARVVDAETAERAPYLIRATYTRWKDVLAGDLDPVKGMMQGKLKVRGNLPTILRYVSAAHELVRLTGEVDTTYPDEG